MFLGFEAMNTFEKPDLILASKSPRRKYLLENAGLSIRVVPSGVRESDFQPTSPDAYVKILSQAKAEDIAPQYPDTWVLGADTVVVINGKILGKPKNARAASEMLRVLSGQKHQVFTGFTLYHKMMACQYTDAVVTDVFFKELNDREIDWYVATGEPFDKAGAYAIQGMGTFIVKRIHGSYTNVVGLPVCEVIEFLIKKGVIYSGVRSLDGV